MEEAHLVAGGAVAAGDALLPFLGRIGLGVRCGQREEEHVAGGAAVASANERYFSRFHARGGDMEVQMKAEQFGQFDVYMFELWDSAAGHASARLTTYW